MTQILEISPRRPYGATVTDDRHENGNSVSSLVRKLEARDLANQAHTDPLTGALNRQGLREVLANGRNRVEIA